jgi:DNA topoisomerase-1
VCPYNANSNEKDKDTQADTVGCTSLRVEHIEFKEGNIIILDFLGKDSMRYFNEVKVDPRVWKNLNEFVKDKSKDEKIFDRVTPTELNTHLKEFMKGLSAKVFRTYNASVTLQNELKKVAGEDIDDDALVQEKVAYYTAYVLLHHLRRVACCLCYMSISWVAHSNMYVLSL